MNAEKQNTTQYPKYYWHLFVVLNNADSESDFRVMYNLSYIDMKSEVIDKLLNRRVFTIDGLVIHSINNIKKVALICTKDVYRGNLTSMNLSVFNSGIDYTNELLFP